MYSALYCRGEHVLWAFSPIFCPKAMPCWWDLTWPKQPSMVATTSSSSPGVPSVMRWKSALLKKKKKSGPLARSKTRTNQICQTWLWACAEWREVHKSWSWPEVAIPVADQKDHGLWERDCGCHCPGDMAVRMRKVLARPWVGVGVCHLLLMFLDDWCVSLIFSRNKAGIMTLVWPLEKSPTSYQQSITWPVTALAVC